MGTYNSTAVSTSAFRRRVHSNAFRAHTIRGRTINAERFLCLDRNYVLEFFGGTNFLKRSWRVYLDLELIKFLVHSETNGSLAKVVGD